MRLAPTRIDCSSPAPYNRLALNRSNASRTSTRRAHGHLTPRAQVFEQEGVTIGMAHGHLVMPAGDTNALEALRRRMAVDVLLTGATGKAQTLTTARGVLVNPGSITGAKMSPLASGCASYTLLVLDNGKVRFARGYRAI